jgi:small-conductance mechanosensitive channel
MENTNTPKLKWYHYISAFFSGIFLANVVPHFVNGVSGNPFPTPFADPPGEGLSSPLTNVLWALANLLIGYLLFRASKITSKTIMGLIVFFIGAAAISIQLSIHFAEKVKM